MRLSRLMLFAAPATLTDPLPAQAAPKLVVLITVDQMRADYLDKWSSQFTGGLARLNKGGAKFTNAFQDHANTETAPGHSTLLSGREPYRTGIVLNSEGVNDPRSPMIGGGGPGASPVRFRGTTLVDWIKSRDSRSRALSVSRKDRGAILPVGRSKQAVFWYATDGRFTTSTYYADALPDWVNTFNDRKIPQSYAGKEWMPLLPLSNYPEPDSVPIEDMGREPTFPHVLTLDTAVALGNLIAFPWMDDLTVQFALAGVNAMHLGAGPSTDVLAVSLSTTDAVGHRFGMSSRELHDQVLRVDRAIGVLVDSLYKLRDSSSIVFALTGDHGVTDAPEIAGASTSDQHPTRVDLYPLAERFADALAKHPGADSSFGFSDAIVVLNRNRLKRAHIDADSLVAAFADSAKHQPGVYRVDLVKDLATADTVKDVIARRWRHAIPPDWPAAAVVTLNHGNVWGASTTGVHGSPWDDDCHVPIVFYGAGVKSGVYDELARTVDIAPTFAQLVGVKVGETIDGHALTAAVR